MLVFLRHKIAFLATPKTGTTAVELALKSRAEIIFAKSRKHVTAARYANQIAPFLEETFGVRPESVAVMREPVDQIRSWYKYRSQKRLADSELSTKGITFDQFVSEVCSDAPPERAQIGRQFSFLTDGKTCVLADHLFAYEDQQTFVSFMSKRLKQEIELAAKNVSPFVDAPLSDAVHAKLRKVRAEDFALYDAIKAAGGHLQTPRD